jgi:hypothetical protein
MDPLLEGPPEAGHVGRPQAAELVGSTTPNGHLAMMRGGGHARLIEETVITREEAVALLFNVSDMAASLAHIEQLLEEDDGEEDDTG